MAEKISPHNHCHMCMKVIPVGEKLCSEECRQKYTTLIKRRRIIWLFLWAIIVGSIIVLMLVQTP
jgi:predicted nucleic acid-binding Zn ribbon protein